MGRYQQAQEDGYAIQRRTGRLRLAVDFLHPRAPFLVSVMLLLLDFSASRVVFRAHAK